MDEYVELSQVTDARYHTGASSSPRHERASLVSDFIGKCTFVDINPTTMTVPCNYFIFFQLCLIYLHCYARYKMRIFFKFRLSKFSFSIMASTSSEIPCKYVLINCFKFCIRNYIVIYGVLIKNYFFSN